MKILHIISNLSRGGAETTLLKLLLNDNKNQHIVISLKSGGELAKIINDNNIKLYQLNFKIYNLYNFFKISKIISHSKPDLIQTWMYHSDFIGLIYSVLYNIRCFWCVRSGKLTFNSKNLITIIIRKVCAIFSNLSNPKIIYCSHNSKSHHEKLGYNKHNSVVIPNGYDTKIFVEKLDLKKSLRNIYRLKEEVVILGLIGRLHEQKNHIFFLEIIYNLKKNYKEYNIVGAIIAPKIIQNNLKQKLDKFISKNHLEKNIIFIDGSKNLNEKINIIDINILCSSWGEAFPNVVCETMLTGIPNIVFNIGDVKTIIQNNEYIVKELKINFFVQKIINLVEIKKNQTKIWENVKIQQRNQIILEYTLDKMIDSYDNAWREIK